ncbi:MAG: N-acyl homoserine lactonase AttM [Smithella sp. PtaU1.Bin162]|nr:MAG: N-acyl homoserine lactonase AttM [Smithella sp. PtaU1.Bin162]
MKLYIFQCGIIKTKKHLITMGRGLGEEFDVPVPFFLIRHPKGNVLFDTGNALAVAHDKIKHWGANVIETCNPFMNENDYVVAQLADIGIKSTDITHVIFSHLHLDHAGGTGDFPNAAYYTQRAELQYAYVPDFFQASTYIRADFDKPHLNWNLLDGYRDNYHDVFGDGKIQIVFTPGHTPGSQSLLLKLEKWGPTLLTGDCVYTEEILDEDILPGICYSPSDTIQSIKKIRALRRDRGTRIITGHDPIAWIKFKLAPACYE